MSAPDPFAFAGDNDADVVSLFRQWVALIREHGCLCGDADSEALGEDVFRRASAIEEEIIATPGGAASMGFKAYLACRAERGLWTADPPTLRLDKLWDDHDYVDELLVSIFRPAAAVWPPDLVELLDSVIHEDAPLIDAYETVRWVRLVLGDPLPGSSAAWYRQVEKDLAGALERIATTPARTPRGEAIKATPVNAVE